MSSSIEAPATAPRSGRPAPSLRSRFRLALLFLPALIVMIVMTVLMVLVSIVSLFQARRFCTEVLAKWQGQLILWLFGVKMVVHREEAPPEGQVVYISNHTSTLDCFILIALGLPNARFFLSGFLRKNPLICIMGYLTGTIWTVPQSYPERRTRIFQRAERILRRTGASVYLSPEGERVRTGQIGHFNKGAFHLATRLGAPLVPFYIAIPEEVDPGLGIDVRPGVVHVYFQRAIPTRDWKVEELDQNRKRVRDFFVELHEKITNHGLHR